MRSQTGRGGLTLIEVLVVVAIVATAIALSVVAVVRVREAAARSQSENNLRQIILAVHNCGDANGGRLPTNDGPSLFCAILPYVEQPYDLPYVLDSWLVIPPVTLFLSPADPTAALAIAELVGASSYGANAQAFAGNARLATTFADGTSNTIGFAEHYAYKCGDTVFSYNWYVLPNDSTWHRATFADEGDVVPITAGHPPTTLPSTRGVTFQVAVLPLECNPLIPQTPHPSGMLVALADGSVRTVAPSISETTFWAAVTPAGGEILGGDW